MRSPSATLRKSRPDDDRLNQYYRHAKKLFDALAAGFSELGEFFSAKDTESVVRLYRNESALFRPIGLSVFVRIIARLTRVEDMNLADAVRETAQLPRDLGSPPYAGLMWNPATRTIRRFTRGTLLELLWYMLGRSQRAEECSGSTGTRVGDQDLELPSPVVRVRRRSPAD